MNENSFIGNGPVKSDNFAMTRSQKGQSGSRLWCLFICLFLAGTGLGYLVRGILEPADLIAKAGTSPDLDYFIPPQSFSEIRNAKEVLHGLIMQSTARVDVTLAGLAGRTTDSNSDLLKALGDLEQVVNESKSEYERDVLVGELLRLYKWAGLWDKWVETYVKILYEQPTNLIVGDLASEAVNAGKLSGQEKEILQGFYHLSSIPMQFENKIRVQAALRTSPGEVNVNPQVADIGRNIDAGKP
jgi:hypothetical protein